MVRQEMHPMRFTQISAERIKQIESPRYIFLEHDSPKVLLNLEYFSSLKGDIGTVGHIAPLWKRLSPEGYAGTEIAAGKNVERNAAKKTMRQQTVFGHPDNAFLEDRPRIITFAPEGEDFHTDHPDGLLGILRKDPQKAGMLEEMYVKNSYKILYGLDTIGVISVVHDHSSRRQFGIEFAESTGKNVVFTIHGPVSRPDSIDERDLASLASCKDKQSVSFVGISADQMSWDPTLPWGAVIHNGIDLSEFPFDPEAPKGLKETGEEYFSWIGRIADTKGLEIAILAAAKVKKKLAVMGKVEDTPNSIKHYEDVIKPLLEKHKDTVVMVGEVGKKDKAEWLSRSLGVICSARWHEPFGYTSIEGPALGVPTIGPNYGAMKETIVDGVNGFRVAIDEPSNITNAPQSLDAAAQLYAEKMQLIIDGKGPDPETCREYTAVHFSDTVMAAKYEIYYKYVTEHNDPTKIMTFREERLKSGLVMVTPILVDKRDYFKNFYSLAA